MTKKVYIAALYSRMDEMQSYGFLLESGLGYTVTSKWMYGNEIGMTNAEGALMDIEDLTEADICLSFTQPFGSMFTGGGRHTELGYALAIGKECVIIGEREQIFHHLPQIKQYDTFDDYMKAQTE